MTVALRPLGGTGTETTALGFGCADLHRLGSSRQRKRVIDAALDAGIRHFDVAPMYGLGLAEAEVGAALRAQRAQVTLATKFGILPSRIGVALSPVQTPLRRAGRRLARRGRGPQGPGAPFRPGLLYRRPEWSAAGLRRGLEASLRRLGTDGVDLYLCHEPAIEMAAWEEVARFLDDARAAGLIGTWGLAGAAGPAVGVARALGGIPVLQTSVSALATMPVGVADATVGFGAIAGGRRIAARLRAEEAERRRWCRELGVDCGAAGTLAGLLLAEALSADPARLILFGSASGEQVTAVAAAVERWGGVPDVVQRFARLRRELEL